MAQAKKKKTENKKKQVKKSAPIKKVKVLNLKPKAKKQQKLEKKMVAKKKGNISSNKVAVAQGKIKQIKKTVVKKAEKKVAGPEKKKSEVIREKPIMPVESLFKAKIKVVGVGGGGGSIVSEIGRSLEKATFVIADTDIRALKKKSGIKYFWFGEELTHGLGTGVNVELAKQAAEQAKDKISHIFKDQDIVIFIASLGGGLGSGATQAFVEAAREFGGITFGIFTLPFKFEGKIKSRIALNALRSLRQALNVSLVIPNEKIFKVIDPTTPITSAFSTVNKSLIGSLESLIDLIYNPGVINIDFADFRTILRGTGNTAFLNTVEESGKDRVEKVCEKILLNPLLQNNSFEPEKILFNIAGSDALSMFEVEKISTHISNLNPKAKIIFGISKNQKLKNKLKTTILMTGGSKKEEAVAKVPEPEKEAKEVKEKPAIKKESKKEKKAPEKMEIKKKQHKEKVEIKKPQRKKETNPQEKGVKKEKKEELPVLLDPVFNPIAEVVPVLEQKKVEIAEMPADSAKKTIRRNALEIKKAEELQEKQKIEQEKEWEIPAFLRKVKFKS